MYNQFSCTERENRWLSDKRQPIILHKQYLVVRMNIALIEVRRFMQLLCNMTSCVYVFESEYRYTIHRLCVRVYTLISLHLLFLFILIAHLYVAQWLIVFENVQLSVSVTTKCVSVFCDKML